MLGYTISRYVRDVHGTVIRMTREGFYRSESEGREALRLLQARPGLDLFVLFEPRGQSIGRSGAVHA